MERKKQEKKVFRVYVTDALKSIVENASHHYIHGAGMRDYGSQIKRRWIDIVSPPTPEPEAPEDARSAEEIAADIFRRMRGEKQGGENS